VPKPPNPAPHAIAPSATHPAHVPKPPAPAPHPPAPSATHLRPHSEPRPPRQSPRPLPEAVRPHPASINSAILTKKYRLANVVSAQQLRSPIR
jgi:hypothetical protein